MAAVSDHEFYWRAVLGAALPSPEAPPTEGWRGLAFHLSPCLLKALLEERGIPVPADLAATASSLALLQRFRAIAQREWLGRLIAAGFSPVVLKGFGIAYRYYGDAGIWRRTGDLDLLFAPRELEAARNWLIKSGFAPAPVDEKPWGPLHDTSEVPLVASDGSATIDLHSEADAPPLPRGLSRDEVFAAALEVEEDGLRYRMPAPMHTLLITLANAAKDKFGPYTLRRGVDVARILAIDGGDIGWRDTELALRAAQLWRPTRRFLQLLVELGLPPDVLPEGFAAPPRGLAAPTYEDLLRDWQEASALTPSRPRLAAREWLLAAEPATALRYGLRRLSGLLRRGALRGR